MGTPGQAVPSQSQPAQAAPTPVTAVASSTPPIHPAWYARAASWLLGIGKAVKNGILKAAGEEPKVAAAIQQIAPTIEAVSNLVVPGSGSFEQHIVDVYGVFASALHAAGDAAGANGLSVTFDAELVAAAKALKPAVDAFLHPQAGAAAPAA